MGDFLWLKPVIDQKIMTPIKSSCDFCAAINCTNIRFKQHCIYDKKLSFHKFPGR